jgi:hypothetical protein
MFELQKKKKKYRQGFCYDLFYSSAAWGLIMKPLPI